MSKEIKKDECALHPGNISYSYTGRHHFGPERFYAFGLKISCLKYDCPLYQGVDLKSPTICGYNLEDITVMINEGANTPETSLNDQIVRLRLNCPLYRKIFLSGS